MSSICSSPLHLSRLMLSHHPSAEPSQTFCQTPACFWSLQCTVRTWKEAQMFPEELQIHFKLRLSFADTELQDPLSVGCWRFTASTFKNTLMTDEYIWAGRKDNPNSFILSNFNQFLQSNVEINKTLCGLFVPNGQSALMKEILTGRK